MKKVLISSLLFVIVLAGAFVFIRKNHLADTEIESVVEVEEETTGEIYELSVSQVNYTNDLNAYLCVPDGEAPFPAVIYNHGGLGDKLGGDPEGTCEELAKAGYVGFSPLRRETESMTGHDEDIEDAIDYMKALEYVDLDRLGMIGFSRGGLLSYLYATENGDFCAYIIMAPALGGKITSYDFMDDAKNVDDSVLLMASENDIYQADHVDIVQSLEESFLSYGKEVELIIYPPYGDDGHYMFFEIGDYWEDVLEFLESSL